MDTQKQALVVGNVKLSSADSGSIDLSKLVFFILDKRTGLGKSLDNTSTRPLNKKGYFAFALPQGQWELNRLYYSSSYTSGNYVYTTTIDIPLNLLISVEANTVVNVGEVTVIAREYDKKIVQISNLDFIEDYIKTLPISDELKQSTLINIF